MLMTVQQQAQGADVVLGWRMGQYKTQKVGSAAVIPEVLGRGKIYNNRDTQESVSDMQSRVW